MKDTKQYLIGELQGALNFEDTFVAYLKDQAGSVGDQHVRQLHCQAAAVAKDHKKRLEERLRQLGAKSTTAVADLYARRLSQMRIADDEHLAPDLDSDLQQLVRTYGVKQLKCNMYRNVKALARAANDEHTAALAQSIVQEEESSARSLIVAIGLANRTLSAPIKTAV